MNQEQEYIDGYYSFNGTAELEDNPYLRESLCHELWRDGWCMARWHKMLLTEITVKYASVKPGQMFSYNGYTYIRLEDDGCLNLESSRPTAGSWVYDYFDADDEVIIF